jgi:hypothetical protein
MPPGQNWPRRKPGRFFSGRHEVEVRFGDPIRPHAVEDRHDVMDRVRAFWERKDLAPPPALEPKEAAPDPAPMPSGRFRPAARPAAPTTGAPASLPRDATPPRPPAPVASAERPVYGPSSSV